MLPVLLAVTDVGTPALADVTSGEWVEGRARIEVSTSKSEKLSSAAPKQLREGESYSDFRGRLKYADTPLREVQAELEKRRTLHHVKADQLKAVYPGEDWASREECREAFTSGVAEEAWFYKNHYSACQVATVFFDSFVCTNTECRWAGSTTARMTVVGRGWHSYRYIDWDVYLDNFKLVWGREYHYLRYILDIPCEVFADEGGQCSTDQPAGVMRSLGEWRATPWAYFHTETSTPNPSPNDPRPEEKRAHFRYTPMITSFEGGSVSQTPWTVGRCDNAAYISGAGCMFPGTLGVMHYDYNDPSTKESVEFFYQAMHHLDELMPNSVGLYVPGGWYRQPITDRYEPLHRNRTGNRSRDKVRAKCAELYGADYTRRPRPDGGMDTMECDEFPFSATYENANYDDVGTAATWAVKPVLAAHNSKTGQILGQFYEYDHILEDDGFYVAIDNAP